MIRRYLSFVIAALSALMASASPQIYTRAYRYMTPEPKMSAADSLEARVRQMVEQPDSIVDTLIVLKPLPRTIFLPGVYTHFTYFGEPEPFKSEYSGNPALRWLDEANALANKEAQLQQRYILANPERVRYNIATLPEAPKRYMAKVDPKKHSIEIHEVLPESPDKMDIDIQKRLWIRSFAASLQFSQGYVSPNWYQGGVNSLNLLANIYYNVKLNPAFHPNLLFESTFQYKLGLNNAPDDSLRNYSITEDLLQINSTFGVKAAKRWYYSISAQFRTQVVNSYVKNTTRLSSALLSPAELNAGLGMTYNYANKKKTFTFDASISPISYNMKICIKADSLLNHEDFNVPHDKDYAMQFGSTAECKLMWQMARNIQFRSRIFAFTDYSYVQADWENTLSLDINRYLSTQIYAHLRYDSTTPRCDDPHWHKLQIKEILSFGVAYKFSSI